MMVDDLTVGEKMPKSVSKKKAVPREQAQRATLTVGEIELPKTQAAIIVSAWSKGDDGKMGVVGTLQISRGGVRWTPSSGKKAKKMTWYAFAAKMN